MRARGRPPKAQAHPHDVRWFIFGVLPLAVSIGACVRSRVAIGTTVLGGMLAATVLAIFYVPMFFVLARRGTTPRGVSSHEHDALIQMAGSVNRDVHDRSGI